MTKLDRVMFYALSACLLAALAFFLFYWFSLPEWGTHPISFVGLTAVLLLTLAGYLHGWTALPAMRRPLPVEPEPGLRVAVFTTFVPSGESIDMLRDTLQALVAIRYPHDTWVLDEGNDPDVVELCRELGAKHFSRHGKAAWNTAHGPLKARSKHGNVNAWLQAVAFERYDIVTAFDPDHVPDPSFLDRVLGFFRSPEVAFVQVPQVYYNQQASFIARGAAEETYTYYSSGLMSGYGLNYTVVVGCHCTHRVVALREIGGFAAHDGEDLLTGLYYQAAGWKGIYAPEILAIGLTPVDWPSYFRQQRRWCRAVIDIKLRILPTLYRRLPRTPFLLATLQGFTYFLDVLLPLAGTSLLVFMLITGETSVLSRLIGHQLLMLLLAVAAVSAFRQRFFLDPAEEVGLHWRSGFLRMAKWPFIGLGIVDAVLNRSRDFELTSKVRLATSAVGDLWPHLAVAVGVGLAWAFAVSTGDVASWALHFWSLVLVATSGAVFASGFVRPPPPFDRSILRHALVRLPSSRQRRAEPDRPIVGSAA